jgi:hypothetical protein
VSKQDLSLFGVALLEDVVAARPTIGALTNACKHLRRSSRFVPAICEVPEALAAETHWQSALLADVRDFRDRLDHARIAVAEARKRVQQGFERMVRFCQSRVQSQKSLEGFDAQVIAEARRRLGPEVDSITAEANRRRLAPLLSPRAMPKKDAGWADAEAISNDMRCSTEIMKQ